MNLLYGLRNLLLLHSPPVTFSVRKRHKSIRGKQIPRDCIFGNPRQPEREKKPAVANTKRVKNLKPTL